MYLKRKKKVSTRPIAHKFKRAWLLLVDVPKKGAHLQKELFSRQTSYTVVKAIPISTSKITSPIHLGPKQNNQKHKDETEQPKTPRTKTKPANNA